MFNFYLAQYSYKPNGAAACKLDLLVRSLQCTAAASVLGNDHFELQPSPFAQCPT